MQQNSPTIRTSLKIPPSLLEKLNEDLRACVAASVAEFGPVFLRNQTVFFPAFTDHGARHIEETLATATELISERSWQVLTPDDIAVLILATMLHDSAMHLSVDGFIELMHRTSPPIPGTSDRPWSELWEKFIAEAQRWNNRTLLRVFGADATPVRIPRLSKGDLTNRDHLLIGEFLRRHHARLAQEIVWYGFPGSGEGKLQLQHVPQHIAELAGSVARSHGFPLRDMVEYLGTRYRLPVYRNIHAVYLMVLLRIADYIQIHSSRAPRQYRMVYRIDSTESKQEWEAHAAISDISAVHNDPEALYLEATPPDIETFLRIRNWLSGIQTELDLSWAVLGEVFGRFTREGLHQLGLTLRRIRSNLELIHSPNDFSPFIPVEARFATAEAELLDLLVKPLYGNRPEIGIRELCQNAVDAVREKQDFLKRSGNRRLDSRDSPGVVITLKAENRNFTFTIADSGMGMTPEVIVQYFLRAGASFRRSPIWKDHFEDVAGRSRVLRSGRFGIGALAAFLLGDRIHVRTRALSEPEGVQFSASISDGAIELTRVPDAPFGTAIEIPLNEEVYNILAYDTSAWEWYHLPEPEVKREIVRDEQTSTLPPPVQLPLEGKPLPPEWRRLCIPDVGEVHWTYSRDVPHLCCNGIRIGPDDPNNKAGSFLSQKVSDIKIWGHSPFFVVPRLSVFDPDGKLPLSIQRDKLASALPFEDELVNAMLLDFIAFHLVHAPGGPMYNTTWLPDYYARRYRGFASRFAREPLWFSHPAGAVPMTPWHMRQTSPSELLIIPQKGKIPDLPLNRDITTFSMEAPYSVSDLTHYLRWLSADPKHTYDGWACELLTQRGVMGARLLIPMFWKPRLAEIERHSWGCEEELRTRHWLLWKIGRCPEAAIDYARLTERTPSVSGNHRGPWSGILAEWYYEERMESPANPIIISDNERFVRQWIEIVGSPIIPYDLQERRHVLRNAFEFLDEIVSAQVQLDPLAKHCGM